MRYKKNQKNFLMMTVLILCVFSFLGSASAMQFNFGSDTTMDCDVMFTYGAGIRASDRDDALMQEPNTDDPNRNFHQWDLINNKITVLADIDIQYKNAGLFIRPKAFYDHVYMSDNANDSPATNNALAGDLIGSSDEWADDVEDVHGRKAEILDLFGYLSYRLFDRELNLRVGKQVISWGESMLVAGGVSSAQSPLDYSAAVAVGTEVKEFFLPTESAYLQMEITQDMALAGYYQWKWEKNRLMEGGTFFSQADMLDELKAPTLYDLGGGQYLLTPRGEDEDAKDSGQFGVALTYVLPVLDATEVGAYFINYHDKNPMFLSTSDFSAYYLAYTEDIKLYGASVSSMAGDAQVSGEFTYRQDVGFQRYDAAGIPVVEMGDYWQAQVSSVYILPLQFFANQLMAIGEVACGKEVKTEDNEFAWRFSALLQIDWFLVFSNTDMGLNLAYSDIPNGTNLLSPEGEDAAAASIGVDLIYKSNFKSALTYENRFKDNVYKDRDTISLTLSYSF